MGEEERQEKSARALEQCSNLRSAIDALQKYCRRNDHSSFEVAEIFFRGNTFESLSA
jgi:hypothetical protein